MGLKILLVGLILLVTLILVIVPLIFIISGTKNSISVTKNNISPTYKLFLFPLIFIFTIFWEHRPGLRHDNAQVMIVKNYIGVSYLDVSCYFLQGKPSECRAMGIYGKLEFPL